MLANIFNSLDWQIVFTKHFQWYKTICETERYMDIVIFVYWLVSPLLVFIKKTWHRSGMVKQEWHQLKNDEIRAKKYKKKWVDKCLKSYKLSMKVKKQNYQLKNIVKLVLQHKKIAIKKSSEVALSTKNTTAKLQKTWSHFSRKIFGDTEHFAEW